MRTPSPTFDLRAALCEELRIAATELETAPLTPRAVHHCRVQIKRARALARVGRTVAPGLSSVFVDSARTLMRALAEARHAAALTEAAKNAAASSKKKAATAFETIAQSLDDDATANAALNLEAARAGLRDLLALAQVWPEASQRQIRKGARRIDRKARRARSRGVSAIDPADRHDWRKREKDRFFAASILGDAWPGKRRRKITRKIGDALGEERDTLLLMERLVAHPELAGDETAMRRALEELNRRRARYARRADRLAKRLF